MSIHNPVLRGFNPDPSLCRVGDDYYMATSTFDWFPGVSLHHSTDLSHWTQLPHPLTRATQLDMRGNPDSCGVWAPALSYADGLFWLAYTNVRRYDGNYKDTPNFLVTAPDINGPWSDPVYLNASGFDPSLFHDTDGRKWLVNMVWDHRSTMSHRDSLLDQFGGIVLQEYDPAVGKLIGPVHRIFHRSEFGFTEAPHLWRRGDYYYLIVAEGGTGYGHMVTHARSKCITGPYELHPNIQILSTREVAEAPLQRVGHGQMCEGPEPGTMIHSFLCSRPLPGRRSTLGREAGIEILEWHNDDWLYRRGGGVVPTTELPGPDCAQVRERERLEFSPGPLPLKLQWLRSPEHERLFSTDARPGWLRLFGRDSVGSWFEQALVARRQSEHICAMEVEVDFTPTDFQHQAGLIAYYGRHQFHYAYLTCDEDGFRRLAIQSCNGVWPEGHLNFPIGEGIEVPDGLVGLKLEIDHAKLQFFWCAAPGGVWQPLGPVLDASLLSDESGRGEHANFTGTFVGICAQDLTGHGHSADFRGLTYSEKVPEHG